MHIASIGIDLGKYTFHLDALDEHGSIVIKKKFSRKQLLAYTANLPEKKPPISGRIHLRRLHLRPNNCSCSAAADHTCT